MSPYIVTTWPECLGCLSPSTDPHHVAPPLSRVAVGTLDEAVGRTGDAAWPQYTAGTRFKRAAHCISESGGSVGPLPDGSLIEVSRVKWDTIIAELPPEDRERMADTNLTRDAEVLAAFNQRQAS